MKKLSLIVLVTAVSFISAFAGGLVTNLNQSAQYIRMLSRNATNEIDAVYYNPAGLTQMKNGWHFAVASQTIFQDRNISSTYPLLTGGKAEYKGEVRVPVLPSGFAVYKKGKSAFSFGFGVTGGGGSAEYANGLPSFESQISALPVMLNALGVPTTGYESDIYFNGSSAYWGFQLNYSYQVNEALSISAGARTIIADNTYEGHIRDIQVNPSAPSFGLNGNYISATSVIEAAGSLGLINEAQTATYKAMVADKKVDAAQSGIGYTPILGANVKPNENWDIAVKYEFRTKLVLKNKTKVDDTGMYADGDESRADVPAILSFGINHKIADRLLLSASTTTYMDKAVNWGIDSATGTEREIDENTTDYCVGVEYRFSNKLKASLGWQYTDLGIAENWRNDITHSFATHSAGCGIAYSFSERFTVDLGVMNTFYKPVTRTFANETVGTYNETYDRTNLALAIGLTYSIFK